MKLNLAFLDKLPEKEKTVTLSTKITLLRFICVPFIIFFIFRHNWIMAFFLVMFSAITDILDGIIARIRNEKTILGACLDPIADKLLVLSCYSALIFSNPFINFIPKWFAIFVFFKELVLVIGAAIFYWIKDNPDIKPTLIGKITMWLQTIFIMWILICYYFQIFYYNYNIIFTAIIIFFVLASLFQYIRIGIRQILLHTYIQNK